MLPGERGKGEREEGGREGGGREGGRGKERDKEKDITIKTTVDATLANVAHFSSLHNPAKAYGCGRERHGHINRYCRHAVIPCNVQSLKLPYIVHCMCYT